ncbi:MAG: glycosyltransferase family 2 protein [Bacteroidales bacterium]|nr:glycosyltransferase family 2 protein [Bacteroidales bacterium]
MDSAPKYSICVVMPVYNNAGTVLEIARRIIAQGRPLIAVCDGCTDGSTELLENSALNLDLIVLPQNRGKGEALKAGFRRALERGFDYAVTIDSDGQHFPEDLPAVFDAINGSDGALIVGSRCLNAENMPSGNTFANRFSNFQFTVNTWISLPDTQTGYRAYPLKKLPPLELIPSRYEAELALLVLCAWRGVKLESLPLRVFYPPQGERVTHFRPFADFSRIFILNTVLLLIALVYGWPRTLARRIFK